MKVSITAIAACGAVPLMMTLITLRYMTIMYIKYINCRYQLYKYSHLTTTLLTCGYNETTITIYYFPIPII